MRFPATCLFLLLCLPLGAANFTLSASLSKQKVELGESFQLQVAYDIDGNFAFSPQLEVPPLEGLQLRGGPQQSQNMRWENGVVKAQVTLSWELIAIKSGRLKIGPFKASAKDPATGEISRQAPALYINVVKPVGPAIPPIPTPEADAEEEELRGIKPDLGFPWARAAALAGALLALAGLGLWLALRPVKVKKIEAVRDPGQVALQDLARAEELLRQGEEQAYLKELARVIRFYLRHRLKMPEREMTLSEAERFAAGALRAAQGEPSSLASISRLIDLLFGGKAPDARDFSETAQGLRSLIVSLERGAHWSGADLMLAALDEAREKEGKGEAWFRAMKASLMRHLELLKEELGPEAVEKRLARGLEELGPAAGARVGALLLSKPLREDLDLEKLDKDLKRLAPLLYGAPHEKGAANGK